MVVYMHNCSVSGRYYAILPATDEGSHEKVTGLKRMEEASAAGFCFLFSDDSPHGTQREHCDSTEV